MIKYLNKNNLVIHLLFSLLFLSFIFAKGLVHIPLILITIFVFFTNKNFEFFKKKEIIFFLIFYFYLLLTTLVFNDIHEFNQVKTILFFFRFIFFTWAFHVILNQDTYKTSFNVLVFLLFLILIDSIFQFLTHKNLFSYDIIQLTRVSSFFRDELILGSFVSKILPIIFISYLKVSNKLNNKFLILIIISSYILVFLSGERVAFFNLNFFYLLILVFITKKKKFKVPAILFYIFFFVIMSFFILKGLSFVQKNYFTNYLCKNSENLDIKSLNLVCDDKEINSPRLSLNTIKEQSGFNFTICLDRYTDLPLDRAKKLCSLRAEKPIIILFGYKIHYLFSVQHHSHFEAAWNMFKNRPIIGNGIKSFRYICEDYKINRYSCSSHPHNHIAQMLSESGIIGLIFFGIFYLYFIHKLILIFLLKKIDNKKFIECIALSAIIINFFPFLPSGFLFTNWSGTLNFLPLFYYFSLTKKK